ncbi:MAG TPA: late competence development ComFB family protein [Firmicutes bacterium]|nr:late competence development ComFB family protein [Bacillota bacterium]
MYKLNNIMEQMVLRAIDEVADEQQFCNCPRCRLDIAALALNKLPPRYAVTSRGEAYSRTDCLELQKNLDIISVIFEAIKIVQRKPRHGG